MKGISLLSGYFFLILGVVAGIAANGYLKTTEGFTKTNPSIFCAICILICIYSLSKAMMVIPVSFTYATYGALTIIAVTLFGVYKYNQTPNIYGEIGLVMIILGVVLLNTLGKIK